MYSILHDEERDKEAYTFPSPCTSASRVILCTIWKACVPSACMEMIDTAWTVLDGAPSSGKTTTILALSRKGLRIVPEVARAHVEMELARGHPLSSIRGDQRAFQASVIALLIERESRLPPSAPVILDGALPGCSAHSRLHHLHGLTDPLAMHVRRYAHIFLLDRLPFEKDHVRTENEEMAIFLDRAIEDAYRSLGYFPIRVPIMTPQERATFILERMTTLHENVHACAH